MSLLLSSSIIDKLSQKNLPFGIAYFFFNGRDSRSELQLHHKLIRSLIEQFSRQRGGTPTELADLYNHCGDHHQSSVDQLQNTLRDIVDGFSRAYIVIDALDECTDRKKTLIWVNTILSDTDRPAGNLHILVTSRPERDIDTVFSMLDPDAMDIGEVAANQDISNYLDLQMKSKFKQYSESTQRHIESGLRERAEGSYVIPTIF